MRWSTTRWLCGLRAHLKKLSAREGVSEDAHLAESLARVEQVHGLYLRMMHQEGIDVETRKGLKDKLKPDIYNKLKQKKHLPGQKSSSAMQVHVSTESVTPPPPPSATDLLPPGWVASTERQRLLREQHNYGFSQTQLTVPGPYEIEASGRWSHGWSVERCGNREVSELGAGSTAAPAVQAQAFEPTDV